MGATRNVRMIFVRRDMQKAYGDEMWVENFRCNFYDMCDTRYIVRRRVREDDTAVDFDGPGCEDVHIV